MRRILFGIIMVCSLPLLLSYVSSDSRKDFDDEVNELQLLYFTGSYEEGISFDEKLAESLGYSKKSIKVASEIRDISNEVIANSKNKDNKVEGKVDFSKYKNFEEFASGIESRKKKSINKADAAVFDATTICGSYWNPKPTSAAPTLTYNSYPATSPHNYLLALGFHKTDPKYGPGYTRAQSYQSWICGVGSFRDHANVKNTTQVVIQNYSGYTPRGEPNPEITTYTWPYLAWPSYVVWWHANY